MLSVPAPFFDLPWKKGLRHQVRLSLQLDMTHCQITRLSLGYMGNWANSTEAGIFTPI